MLIGDMFSLGTFVQIQGILELLSRLGLGMPLLPQQEDMGLARRKECHRKEEGHRGLTMEEEGLRRKASKGEGSIRGEKGHRAWAGVPMRKCRRRSLSTNF